MMKTSRDANRRAVRTTRIAYLLGVVLLLPSLGSGYLFDDYIHSAVIAGTLGNRDEAGEPYVFSDGDPETVAALAERGWFPWWTHPEVRFAFFRPLSSALIGFDISVFGDALWLHHLHSLAWWAVFLLLAAALLRRSIPGIVGSMAVLLLALDHSHVWPTAWISNRNALVAAVPALAGLLAHVRWREDSWKPGAFLGPAGMAVGLLGGEVALCLFGYFVAYEAFAGRGRPGERVWALAPVLAVVAWYAVFYRSLGFGASGSAFYLDPVRDPLAFLAAAVTRLPALLSGAILGFSPDLLVLAPGLSPAMIATGAAGVLLLVLGLRALWRRLDVETRRGNTWLLAGSALSVVPVLATFPNDRLFLVPSVGLVVGLATVLVGGWRIRKETAVAVRTRLPLGALAWLLAVVHLGLSPLQVVLTQVAMIDQGRRGEQAARQAELGPGGEDGPDVVVVTAPDFVAGLYLPAIRAHLGLPVPRSWYLLSLAPYDHRLTRTGPASLELEVIGGGMMGSLFEFLYRPADEPLLPGDRVTHGPLEVAILGVGDGGPNRVSYRFDRDLEDRSLHVVGWRDGALRPLDLPEVGESMVLPRGSGPAGL